MAVQRALLHRERRGLASSRGIDFGCGANLLCDVGLLGWTLLTTLPISPRWRARGERHRARANHALLGTIRSIRAESGGA
jgi:hypothetical protein